MKSRSARWLRDGHPFSVFLAHRCPVDAVHVLDVKPVAENPPAVGVDLGPFLHRVDLHRQAVQVQPAVAGFLVGRDVDDAVGRPGLIEEFLAVRGHRPALEAGEDRDVFFVLEGELMELAGPEVEEAALNRNDAAVVAARRRKDDDPGVDAVEIDLERCRLRLLLLGRVFRPGFLGGLGFRLRLAPGFLFRLFFFDLLQVVFVREKRRRGFRQGNGIDARGVVDDIIELEARERLVEIPEREEEKVIPAFGEDRPEVVEHFVRDPMRLSRLERINPDRGLGVVAVLGVGQPFRVGRPAEVREFEAAGAVDDLDGFCLDVDHLKFEVPVRKSEHRAVGRPDGLKFPGRASRRQLRYFVVFDGIDEIDLILPGFIRAIGDIAPVGRPGRIDLPDALGVRQVVGDAFRGRDRENIAAGFEDGALALGRYVHPADRVGDGS